LFDQLQSLSVALLTATAGLSLFTGGLADAVVIMGVSPGSGDKGFITGSFVCNSRWRSERKARRETSELTDINTTTALYRGYRFPAEIISLLCVAPLPCDSSNTTARADTTDLGELAPNHILATKYGRLSNDAVERAPAHPHREFYCMRTRSGVCSPTGKTIKMAFPAEKTAAAILRSL
jgi:hypothetical protein